MVFSIFTKFPVAIISGGGDKTFTCISRDHMINESLDSGGGAGEGLRYSHPKSKSQTLHSKTNRTQ